jgi:hypothetical protein
MPSLANHQSNDFVKILLIGNAMSGKTGSLTSLVKAGYKLRILDYDNKLDVLKYFILHECPELISNVESRTVRDKLKAGVAGAIIDGKPKAWIDGIKMCDNWKYTEDGVEIDLGRPAEWGPDCILVIDSLSRMCDAAYDFHESITPRGKSGDYDGRAVYGSAQDDVEKFIAMLTSSGMQTNVIVNAHVTFQAQPDGTVKGFPQGVGQKLSPKIPQYFPSAVLYENKSNKRTIRTTSSPLMDLANPAPFAMAPTYPIETGLADFFAVLRSPPKKEAQEKPKSLTLRRA